MCLWFAFFVYVFIPLFRDFVIYVFRPVAKFCFRTFVMFVRWFFLLGLLFMSLFLPCVRYCVMSLFLYVCNYLCIYIYIYIFI